MLVRSLDEFLSSTALICYFLPLIIMIKILFLN
jgi:hypothetical protein